MLRSTSTNSSLICPNNSKTKNRFLSILPLMASLCGSCSEDQSSLRPTYLDFVRLAPVSQTVLFRPSPNVPPFEVAADVVLVYFRLNSSSSVRQSTSRQLSSFGFVRIGFNDLSGMIQFRIPSSVSLNSAIDLAKNLPGVLVAVPDIILRPTIYPNPRFSPGNISDGHYWPNSIDLYSAWDITTGSSNVTVSFIDTGIETQTGHFRGRQIFKYVRCSEPLGNYFDIYQNVLGNRSCFLYDTAAQRSHGTGTAGLAFSPGNDGVGGFGVDWHSRILSFDMYGYGDHRLLGDVPFHDLDAAINVSLSAGANIVIANLGFNVPEEASQIQRYTLRSSLLSSVLNARSKNALIIMGAGNDRFDSDNRWLPNIYSSYEISAFQNHYLLVGSVDDIGSPACSQDYNNPICSVYIGSLHQRTTCNCPTCTLEGNSSFSTARGDVVEIYAPGYRVATASLAPATSEGNFGLQISSGTSYSGPIVAGTASLVLSSNPTLAASEVKRILIQTARVGQCNGIRILNAGAAVRRARDFSNSPSPINTSFGIGNSFRIRSTADGGFMCAVGWTNSRLIKLSRNGTIEWEYRPSGVSQDVSNNYIWDVVSVREGFVGVGMVRSSSDFRAFVFKISTSGNLLWEREIPSPYGGSGSFDQSAHLSSLNDDSVVVVYRSESGLEFRRFNSSGNSVASSTSLTSSDFFSISKVVFNGSVLAVSGSNVVLGTSDPFHNTSRILFFSPSGDLISDRSYSNSPTARQNSIASFFPDNRLILVEAPINPSSISVSILSETGTPISNRSIALSSSLSGLFFRDLIPVRSGGFLLCGVFNDPQNDREILIVRLDSSGNLIWQRTYGGSDIQVVSSALETDFGFLISGSTGHDANLFSIDFNGNPIR